MGSDGIREKDGQKATFLVYGLRNATNSTMSYPALTALEAMDLYFSSRQAPIPNRMNWKDAETDDLIRKAAVTRTQKNAAGIVSLAAQADGS